MKCKKFKLPKLSDLNPMNAAKNKIKNSKAWTKAFAVHYSKTSGMFKKFFEESDKILLGNYTFQDTKYWRGIVFNKMFGKWHKPGKDTIQIKEWLPGFIERINNEAVSIKDKEFLTNYVIPLMKNQESEQLEKTVKKWY